MRQKIIKFVHSLICYKQKCKVVGPLCRPLHSAGFVCGNRSKPSAAEGRG